MNTASFTVDQYVDLDEGYRYTASWNGVVRANSGWHLTLEDAWMAFSAAMARHLQNTAARAVAVD